VKLAVAPALPTVTEAGTARAELFADRLTTEPPAGAACEIVTVQVLVEPETILVGEHCNLDTLTGGGVTVTAAVLELLPNDAVRVTD